MVVIERSWIKSSCNIKIKTFTNWSHRQINQSTRKPFLSWGNFVFWIACSL